MPTGFYPRKDSQLSALEYFKKYSVPTLSGCVEWIGPIRGLGYGACPKRFVLGDYVHRAVYALAHGSIANGMHVCHKCDNPKCIHVEHLFIGTPKENTKDMLEKGRRNSKTKFSDDVIDELRRFSTYGLRIPALAKAFDIEYSYCLKVINGEKRKRRISP